MAQRKKLSVTSAGAGAVRDGLGGRYVTTEGDASTVTVGLATASVVEPAKRLVRQNARTPTIEDRLTAKARTADDADVSDQQSLGQMSREERRKALFGG